jgi:hypothetical protein
VRARRAEVTDAFVVRTDILVKTILGDAVLCVLTAARADAG